MNKSFEEFDHSGDIGIEAWGDSPEQLLENLSRGLFSLMCRSRVEASVERQITVSSNSLEELVINWLSEIVSAADVHGEVYGVVRLSKVGAGRAEGAIEGERYDQARHDLRFEVKAATYHGLKVEQVGGLHHARVVFDL
jgi:SHS2 domain-containing protein